MQTAIIFLWSLLVLLTPIAFFVVAYISYLKKNNVSQIIASLVISLIIHICLTAVTIPLIFIAVFSGAHSNPVGNSLDWKGKSIYFCIDLVFIISGWLLSSLILQKIIKPWQIKFNFGKTPSIFEHN